MAKHRWKRLAPFAPGEQSQRLCLNCGVVVRVGYGGYCYRAKGTRRWHQSNSPHMQPCPWRAT